MKSSSTCHLQQKFTVGDICVLLHINTNSDINLLVDSYCKSLVVIIKNIKCDEDLKYEDAYAYVNVTIDEYDTIVKVQRGQTASFLQNMPKSFTKIYETSL
jgi:hypothetical protein